MVVIADPMDELKQRKREIDTMRDNLPPEQPDEQEMAEREEAAARYASENEAHFVDYAMDCINQSVKAHRYIRRVQAICWGVYEEEEPASYGEKEDWQARTVVPKPFQTVQFGASAIKKAFSPDFLSIQNAKNKKSAQFWQKVMEHQLNEQHAKFVAKFSDAVVMALAIGVSMEIIPRWVPGRGLEYVLTEPWKIHRDPDAVSRNPQSGMYWIHQEWLDYHVLKEGEKKGRYFNVALAKDVTSDANSDNPMMSKEAIAARKKMILSRSKYRTAILTSEFWGLVLAPNGEVLLSDATYTMASNRVIKLPKSSNKTYRWPGISFSPLPHLLRHDGRGLLEGVLTIWEAMNNILCLHQDYLQWVVNPVVEINVDALDEPSDAKLYPGKEVLTRDTGHGQQVIRVAQRRSRTNDVLANQQYFEQLFQRGSFVNDAVQGLPGYRKDMTFRESAMLMDQALGVFGLMGGNIEMGAIQAITLGAQVVKTYAMYNDYLEIFTEQELKDYGVKADAKSPNGVSGVPEFDGSFHVSGIQALLKDNETLANLRDVMIPLSQQPGYAEYLDKYKILRAIEIRTNLVDEQVVADAEEAKLIRLRQELAAAEQQKAVKKMQELQEAMGIAELVKVVQEIRAETSEIPRIAERIMGIGE